jgi:hypothetical protein
LLGEHAPDAPAPEDESSARGGFLGRLAGWLGRSTRG